MKHRGPAGDQRGAEHGGRPGTGFRNNETDPRRTTARLPETAIVQVTGTDPDGEAVGRPVSWDSASGRPPMILMCPEPPGRPALAPGDTVLARLKPIGAGRYEGRTLRRLTETPGRVLGIFHPGRGQGADQEPAFRHRSTAVKVGRRYVASPGTENRIVPTDRRSKADWIVPAGEEAGAEDGEIVLAEPLAQQHRLGLKAARVIERLGRLGDARSISLIAIHTHDIPQAFSPAALEEAARARGVRLGKRTDLRGLGLLTIDGEDARDFDDAVYAEPDAESAGGFRLVVAIADVAHYVKPGSALDEAGRTRGNSVYFPDRVVPMLPEALSNGLCSLRPNEDRGCLFVEMRIDRTGHKVAHRFGRGLMRSAARLTYEQVQDAQDRGDDLGLALPHLYAAFRALLAARVARGTLDLDLPERKVVLNEQGHVTSVAPRPRLDSHRLIEEFMVLANVAAAEELERLHQPCMYRVHAPPSDEKVDALRGFLATIGVSLPAGNQLHPRDLDRVLRKVAGTAEATLVNEVMLRSQSQAAYSPDNIGHFGLALPRYAHFTSPIRRYADLLVHRGLIKALKLGRDGLPDTQAAAFEAIGDQISATERRAQLAERDSVDRYLAAFMAEKVGSRFAARISGVARFGLFVTVTETGASGIVPMATLPDDFWQHDEREQTLTGRRTHLVFRLAQEVEVLLREANPVTGGMVFHVLQGAGNRPRRGGKAASGESFEDTTLPETPSPDRTVTDKRHLGTRPRPR